ncbi:MAG TPA: prepilin-type N-terminal cleavage/methylation domain-containing protein [Pusillimonas sp.]|uniref:PulJ/GspJ family protein n=1 Tax=Pusillimonas sp. TaxID=3040095 RepID=UPI002C502584|nr:prepilin-type N-terminal cleavage/methylation domain-containing protein [Pusillimonas sp.]HUH87849.1 prepilin-type N-terminal cleavage/methylation domain-containing protein [Pusillimonas sp.]
MKHANIAQQGFTLIEVLVALTLLALVSLISWRGLDAVQQTSERLDVHSEDTLALMRALGQMERDLLQHAGADILPGFVDTGVAMTNTSRPAMQMPGGVSWSTETGLTLVRSAGDGLWQRVHWYLDEGKLVRGSGPPSYRLPLPAPDTAVVVLDTIGSLAVRLWQPGKGWVEPPRLALDAPQPDTQKKNFNQPTAATTAGLEITLHRSSDAPDTVYRKVVTLP